MHKEQNLLEGEDDVAETSGASGSLWRSFNVYTRRPLLRVDFSSPTWPMPRTYCTLYCSLSSIYSFLAKKVALLSNVSLIVSCYSTVDSTCWRHDVCSPP
jgi:hypothetical protein